MENIDYTGDDSLREILSELSISSPIRSEKKELIEDIKLSSIDLEEFILNNGAKTVNTTQTIISSLIEQINITPDPELITSVAEMVGSSNKALETLTKIHLNKEKLKQAKELEEFKQSTKLQIADRNQHRPELTREEVMKWLYDSDKDLKSAKINETKKIEDS